MNSVAHKPYRTDWQSFTSCCLDISLHNRYQEGLYLAGACKWVSRRFSKCLVNIGDTLHRHNLRHQYADMEQAHAAANEMGERWLSENMSYLAALEIPYQIMRSDHWLADSEFDETHEKLWSFYYQDDAFRSVVDKDVEIFAKRRGEADVETMRRASLSYLLEETAADILLGKRGGVAHLYPADRHACYGHLIQRADELPSMLKGLENSSFKRLSPSKICLSSAEAEQFGIEEEQKVA